MLIFSDFTHKPHPTNSYLCGTILAGKYNPVKYAGSPANCHKIIKP
jgi:hypothetical protein